VDIASFDLAETLTDMPDNHRRSCDTQAAGFAGGAVQERTASWVTKLETTFAKMQFSVPLIAMLASLGMAAPGNSPTPETFQVDLPTLNGDLGYLISPAEKPETNNTIVKRREGCVACQW
ncbi:hypothetical protein QBC41DRAFT_235896, partial [Cercophora samala]